MRGALAYARASDTGNKACRKPDRQEGLDPQALIVDESEDKRRLPFRIQSPNVVGLRLSEKLADQALLFLIFDTGKQFLAESGDCLWLVERHLVVHLASRKMAGLTSRLKDWLDLCVEVRLLCGGSNRRGGKPLRPCAGSDTALQHP